MSELLALVVALLATLAVTGPMVSVLRRRQIVDIPNVRSSHSEATPRGGGIAVMVGLLAGAAVVAAPAELWALLAVGLAAAMLGLVDDLGDLSATLRLAVQIALSLTVSVMLLQSADARPVGGAALLLLGTLWVTGYVNAFNFMDGVNGISGASGALAGGWFLLLGGSTGDRFLAVGGAVICGACLGFLPWNAPHAHVFLGDVGSYGLGLMIGSLALLASVHGTAPWTAAAPLFLYVADTAWTLAWRVGRGDSWREAHRDHVYQRLCDVGLSHLQVTAAVVVVTVVMCSAYWWLSDSAAIAVTVVSLAFYLASPHVLKALSLSRHQRPAR